MQSARRVKWTEDEYLAREQRGLSKNEFFDGEIYAMAGARFRHNAIAANVIAALTGLSRSKPCSAFTSDQRIRVSATGLYTYADAGVVCGKPQLLAADRMTLLNPILLVEVLSKSTESYDRGEKLDHYRSLPSLQEIILVASAEVRVDHHRRIEAEQWLVTTYRKGAVEVATLSGVIPLDDIYQKVDFADEDE